MLKSAKGEKEVWQCKVYRQRGRKACSAPQLRTDQLNIVVSEIFTEVMKDKEAIIESLMSFLRNVPRDENYSKARLRTEGELQQVNAKKDRLLELSMAGALSVSEFKTRNDIFNEMAAQLQCQLDTIDTEAQKGKTSALQIDKIREALEKTLSSTRRVARTLRMWLLNIWAHSKPSRKPINKGIAFAVTVVSSRSSTARKATPL